MPEDPLSADLPSSLRDILGVCTTMPVLQIHESPVLRPNCVFVIAPDSELVINGDHVSARPFSEPRGRRAPIDMFFRSTAAARGDGIAIVLTGTGSDGAQGVRSVKDAGGVVMAQDPMEAEFSSMPQSAIATGAVDFMVPIARMAERLLEVARSKEAVRSLDPAEDANELRRIVALLRNRTGHDFSSYKRATVMRRVMRRMQVCRVNTLAAYAELLQATPDEAKELFSDLLISVTMFFRDPRAFEEYGALAGTGGKVQVRWTLDEAAWETRLTFRWSESGLQSDIAVPRRKGFGTELIERRVPYELNGVGRLEILPDGAQAVISFPLRGGDSILQTDARSVLPGQERTA